MANEKRLIDANALIATLEKIATEDETPYFHLDEVTQEIFDAPTVDAVEVVHGRWITTLDIDYEGDVMYRHKHKDCGFECETYGGCYNYCPHCGAKMDGGNEDD